MKFVFVALCLIVLIETTRECKTQYSQLVMGRFPPEIKENLIKEFEKNPKPSVLQLKKLARENGLQLYQVQRWFASQRFCRKRSAENSVTEEQQVALLEAYRKHSSNFPEEIYANFEHRFGLTRDQVTSWFNSNRPFTDSEKALLQEHFSCCRYPTQETITSLARQLDTTEKRVRSWFTKARLKQPSSSTLPGRFTPEQRSVLMSHFQRSYHLRGDQLDQVVQQLNLTKRQISAWFTRMRARYIADRQVKY